LLAELGGKPVTSVALAPAELEAGMVAAGLLKDFAQVLVAFQTDAVLGYHSVVTDVVERYAGRKPQSLAEFLAANQSALTA
jgi:NAD(P)H dehydrogenase (quinone)